MGLYGLLRTSASGMSAQSDRLGTVSDNIANVGTTGYKRASTEFETFVLNSGVAEYQSGSVQTDTRRGISEQGGFTSTSSPTDYAIKGRGFFVVAGNGGQPVLTRAASFVKDGNGNLVNAGGYKLLGYPIGAGGGVVNGFAGLQNVNIGTLALKANPSDTGNLFVNLPSNAGGASTSGASLTPTLPGAAPVVAPANFPSANAATASAAGRTQLDVFDSTGKKVTLDVYLTKKTAGVVGPPAINSQWEVTVFDSSKASPAAGGPFPYSAGPLTGSTASLDFDPATGLRTGAVTSVGFTIPGGNAITLDLTNAKELAGATVYASTSSLSAATLPSSNVAGSKYTAKSSLATYDNLGNQVTLDLFYTKTGNNTWEVAVFDRAKAATGGGFPYSSGPLTTAALSFDGTTGALAAGSPKALSVAIPNGRTVTLDLAQTSQLATDYTVLSSNVNGNAPSQVDRIEVSDAGVMSAVYQNGSRVAAYTIPLATVISEDRLTPLAGNAYSPGISSGNVQIGSAGLGGLGTIVSSTLEKSTVDLASELTTMIESQRNFEANSKVFQTGATLLEVLVNLQR